MYEEFNLAGKRGVRGTLVHGLGSKQDAWPAILLELPAGTVPQNVGVSHYQRGPDRRYYEYQGGAPSTVESPLYVRKNDVLPQPWLGDEARMRHLCWLSLQDTVVRYLLCNTHGRLDGAEKATRHGELCVFYVAMVRGVELDQVRRHYDDDYQLVHDHTQLLTDFLDEAIGFPLRSRPDYDELGPKFFARFHELALKVLQD